MNIRYLYFSSLTLLLYFQLADVSDGRTEALIKDQVNAVAVDFEWSSKCLFWSDVTSRGSALRKACLLHQQKGKNSSAGIIPTMKSEQLVTLQNPDGLAVDWVGKNLYWCDKGSDTIEVSDLNGKHRSVLITEGLSEPRAIAVDPLGGYLFWSDWGNRPHIGRASMDGTNQTIIIEEGLGWPNAIALEFATREIFFGDARFV